MKLILCFLFFALCFLNLSAQPHHTFGVRDDSEAAQRYVQWIMRAIDEGRITEVYAALKRASDFVDVSSDISYLQAIVNYKFLFAGETRLTIIDALNTAIETNRWVIFNENTALLLMAENLVAVREYSRALETIERIGISPAVIPADAAMQRLLALRGMAAGGDISALAQFRSGVLNAFDRFPRDPRPLRIFFEFARNRLPEPSVLPSGDINLMELALRRLPFLLEFDPELAWMAVPFIRNLDDARRLLSSYRAGGIQHIHIRDFFPHPASISLALNLGLIDDFTAADELFSGNRGFNNPLPSGISNTVFASNGNPVIQKNIITDVYDLLRSDEGREYFTRKLLEFTGAIIHDEDNDGYIESFWLFHEGVIRKFAYDNNQDSLFDMTILFDTDGIPVSASSRILGHEAFADIQWERYPSVRQVIVNNYYFNFRPVEFHLAPVSFIELGGSRNLRGLSVPVFSGRLSPVSLNALISSASTITRPGVDFDGAIEVFYMERGIPLRAVQFLAGNTSHVSITEFERGMPVTMYIDLDLDGRMETVRRFRTLLPEELSGDWRFFDYRSLIVSSESDWTGDGRHRTKEMYLPDGSVVLYFDIDGSGNFIRIESGN